MWQLGLAALIAVPAVAVRQSGQQALLLSDAQFSASWQEAELSDNRFWAAQWQALESELLQLQRSVAPQGFLQLSNSTKNAVKTAAPPAAKASAKPVANASAKVEVKPAANASAVKAHAKVEAKPAVNSSAVKLHAKVATHESPQDRLDEVKAMTKGLAGKAMLAPMLAMLKGLYEDQKARIGDLNKKEVESKKRYDEQKAAFDKRLQRVEDNFKNHKISEEFKNNQTRDYTMQFKYWEGVRNRNHKQFHNSLKITHGLMAKEKDTIKQYEKALASTTNPILAKAEAMAAAHHSATSAAQAEPAKKEDEPEVVLVQTRSSLAGYCREALEEVRKELHHQ